MCWTSDENPFGSDPDEYFQRHLYMGAFPTVPFPGNDHSVLPSEANDRLYLDYGPLFNALRGRTWLLKPGVVEMQLPDYGPRWVWFEAILFLMAHFGFGVNS